jgi:MoaA/NifB/PqqE/SkfB family radical SAM enzyme
MKILRLIEAVMRRMPAAWYLFALRVHSVWRLRVRKHLGRIEINVVDHCNLSCAGCEHFSPIAQENYVDATALERDFARLSELMNLKEEPNAHVILMGGEPLLHPKIADIAVMVRQYIPQGKITILSNGLLLKRQPDKFWEACAKNGITISVTKYPIKLDTDELARVAKAHNVHFEYYNFGTKTMQKPPLDMAGKQNARRSFRTCHMANNCVQLRDGKLYTCAVIPYIEFFNKYFNKHIEVQKHDYINIYEAKNKEAIFKFLARPAPFCRYCNIKKISLGLNWSVSKKDIGEWI